MHACLYVKGDACVCAAMYAYVLFCLCMRADVYGWVRVARGLKCIHL